MAKKDKRATDELNVALAGIEAALSVLEGLEDEATKRALKMAQEHAEDARRHLVTIQFHLSHL